ncbi:single-stranded-DNA-specific exonuclease [Sphingomonas jejuensis]|uniref:Single-stranded-DNA-specific exonuclease RecJ n=1 Tax=Sphingomonas jejuensis TaxID=904715 RepID=A0ABX0XLY5_9SPHN|nr:single-stranded-DNA-specific exonuclease RecJ [Sphingomonas jejuensis]NJC34249.1 single-stranded-DNA-specific exonuclease [Sphingomonas jejuensis]
MSVALNVHRSFAGQSWRWRGIGEPDAGARPDDLVTRLLLSRGCPDDALDAHRSPTIRGFMPDPAGFQDMEKAAVRLADAVAAQEPITIFGDYDVDGATSSALLMRLLRSLGLAPAVYIPDRLAEGYGPNSRALAGIVEGGTRLIITVDCGAQAFDPLAHAASLGAEVIVVDHHQCASTLPNAIAVINPNRLDEGDTGRAHGHLAAVGVAFLLGAALLRVLRGRGFFADRPEPRLLDLLDLVALGTVADVAALTGLNRAFVAQGLKVMSTRRNIGLAALADAARLTRAPLCQDLGFALGPRINAGGRVGRADLGVRLLTTDDPEEAAAIAAELDRLNEERRTIEATVQEAAAVAAAIQGNRAVLVVAGRGWHPGVIGIVAGRLKESTGRPAIVIAVDEHGVGKGSGRSISGVDLGSAVLAAKEAGLLSAGGGHAMAAGLTVDEGGIDALAAFLDRLLADKVAAAAAGRTLMLDTLVSPRGVAPALAEALEAGGPYGSGWPAPRVAAGPVRIVKADIVGSGGHVRLVTCGDDGARVKAVAFRAADTLLGQQLLATGPDRRLWIAGRLKLDEWNGERRAELHLDDAAEAA